MSPDAPGQGSWVNTYLDQLVIASAVERRQHSSAPRLFWCDKCNVPLIGRSCGRCGNSGRQVALSPPGDVRLGMAGTKRRLRYLFLKHFGVQQLIPDIFVLNKTSGEDRADEVIVDGRRIALLTYDLERKDYRLTLRIDGARMLLAQHPKKTVVLRKTEGHFKGKHLPPEAIEVFDPGIRAGDEVIIHMGRYIGTGSAKVDANSLRNSEKGLKARDFEKADPLKPGRHAWPKDLIKANAEYLAAKKARAEHELREVIAKHRLPLTVSFSGGKDSLVVLDLVASITKDFAVVFIDTGLEHPETREYVRRYARDNRLRLLTASAGDAFDQNFDAFGPPAKDFRWCCKVCKLAPVSALIEERFPKGTLTVEGNRRLESFARARTELVEENPFVPGQIIVNPIRDWTALDVWLYIAWRDLVYNPLYDEHIERVGCWMCPSSLASEAAELSRKSPELAKAWDAKLASWADGHQLPKAYVDYGFWRWKELPPKMKELAMRLGIEAKPKRADTLAVRVIKGVSPCSSGGYSVDAVIETPESVGIRQMAELAKSVGMTSVVEDFGVAMVRSKRASAKVFAGGQITVVGETTEDASELFDKVARALLRASMCTKCGICVRACPQDAIILKDRIRIDDEKCTRCGKCADSCVVAHYFDKLATEIAPRGRTPQRRPFG